MIKQLAPAIRATLVMTVLTGLIYPFVVTGLAKAMFNKQANGSLVEQNGKVIGSELIGQSFTDPGYFQGRPSAAGNGYDPTSSGGSNFGPTNKKLIDRVKGDVAKFRKENPGYAGPIPSDLLTTSASGLDPDISPASAEAQAARVAKARGLSLDRVRQAVADHTQGRQLGFIGEPRVNVLLLNIALDDEAPLRKLLLVPGASP